MSGAFGRLFAQAAQSAASFPDEILNPTEVSGEEAVPIVGRLPGARRMYVLPNDQGEFHLAGSQVIKRIARSQETSGVAGVYEATRFSGRAGATMPRPKSATACLPRRGCSFKNICDGDPRPPHLHVARLL